MAYPDTIDPCVAIAPMTVNDLVDYDRIQAMITESNEHVCACSTDAKDLMVRRLNETHDDVREVLVSVGAEVNQNEQLIMNIEGSKNIQFLL